MKLIDAINNIDKTQGDSWVDYYELAIIFGFHGITMDDEGQSHLKSYYLNPRMDTDTWVGIEVITLFDEPVCFSERNSRKADQHWTMLSKEKAKSLIDFLTPYCVKDEDEFEILDLDREIDETYRVYFADEITVNTCFYNGTYAKIIDRRVLHKDAAHARDFNTQVIAIQLEGSHAIIHVKVCDVDLKLRLAKQ